MPTGFPIDNMPDGTGTEPVDLQRIIAARYATAGILEGALVTGGTDWRYRVTNGAVVVDLGADLAAEVPVNEQYLTPDPAPATGTRTDTIYVHQRIPGSDGDNLVVVGVTTAAAPTVPARAIVLDKRTVPAGATATNATTSTHDRAYAILTGGSLGSLGYKAETSATPRGAETVRGGDIRLPNLPTDRNVEMSFTGTMSLGRLDGTTPQIPNLISVIVRLYIDGTVRKSFELTVDRFWQSKQFTTVEQVPAGSGHTAHFTITREFRDPAIATGEAYWITRAGGTDQYRGNTLALFDRGPVK